MRVRGYSGSSSLPLDTSQCFLLSRLLTYTDRLLARSPRLDFELLQIIHWLLGPEIAEEDLLPLVAMVDGGQRYRRYDREMDYDIRHSRDFANVIDENLRKARKDLDVCVVDLLRGVMKKRLDQLRHRGMSDVEKSLSQFQQMFDLSDLDKEICLFLFIPEVYEEARNFFGFHLGCDRLSGRNLLATMLDCKSSELVDALRGKLSRIGILDRDSRTLSMESGFVDLLQNGADGDMKTQFFRRIDPDPLPLEAHAVDKEVLEHILNLLKAQPSSSTHLCFFGPPGTGKTSLAYGLGKTLGLPIYLVEHGGKELGWKRRAAFTATVNMASQGEGALVIADDSDAVLGTRNSWFMSGETSDKRWLHDILETRGVRMIWTVNSIANMEPSVARRFSFSLCFKPLGRAQRKRIWETILTDYRLDALLDTSAIDDLAMRFEVSPGVIEQAVKKAAEMGLDSREEVHKAVQLSLEAHLSLVAGGRKPIRASSMDTDGFTLDGLNVSGADLQALLKELESFSEYLKHSPNDRLLSMSLLFHGISGSGKSHLARFIAHRLDRELIVKRASDILSMWVGETEQNIRDAFDEAAAKEAVLLFDEADFALGSRDRAAHSWEISQINEFLTAMESFRGIQIYTTNRLTDLDPATLRRFNHKVEFHCLKPEGVVIFYRKLLVPLVGSAPEKMLESELKAISGLTPGDFKVVLTQFRFKAPHEVSHTALIGALKEEARVKGIHAGKKAIGF